MVLTTVTESAKGTAFDFFKAVFQFEEFFPRGGSAFV